MNQIAAKADDTLTMYKANTTLKDYMVRNHRDALDDVVTKL